MEIERLDPVYVKERLSQPPFVTIPGVVNVRDLGGYSSTIHAGMRTRSRLVFRSAELSSVTEEGMSSENLTYCTLRIMASSGKLKLKELGVTTVFDLRSDTEIERYESPIPEVPGVQILRVPVFKTEDYSPEMMAKCV